MFISLFWLIFIIIGILGFGFGTYLMFQTDDSGGYVPDFITPLFAVSIYILIFVILVMMILGKYLF